MLPATLTPVVHSHVLNYRFDDLVVLLFRCSEVGPRQVLQLCDDSSSHDGATWVLFCELQAPLNQIRHARLNADKQDFFVVFEGDAAVVVAFPHLAGPVLVTLDLGVLLEVREHDNERNSLLLDHAPEILHRGLERALRSDEQLVVAAD